MRTAILISLAAERLVDACPQAGGQSPSHSRWIIVSAGEGLRTLSDDPV
jgi:hypothetical protein